MIVNINSKNRSSGSIGNFNTKALNLQRNIRAVKLLDVQIFMSMNTFNPGVIMFMESATGTTRQATIAPGNYNETTILAAVKLALDSSGGQVYTCTYNLATNSITISAGSNFTLYFGDVRSTAYDRLGFDRSNTLAGTSFTGAAIQLSPVGVYFLSVGGLGLNQPWPIFLNAPSFEVAYWSNDIYPEILTSNSGSGLAIRLSDSDGNEVVLTRDWSFNLLFLS